MTCLHHRRSIRLRDHDYSDAGAYFVTVCSYGRDCLFGDVDGGEMRLSQAGQVVQATWAALPSHCPGVTLDAFVVMPNHVHGIFVIDAETIRLAGAIRNSPRCRRGMTIPMAIGRLKTTSAKRINEARRTPGLPVWQRNYYEHIVRDDDELERIRQYIAENPGRWKFDRENPARGAIHESPLQTVNSKTMP